jgi:carotenoid phi-ring synthase / carotenoid chi-ring synthase
MNGPSPGSHPRRGFLAGSASALLLGGIATTATSCVPGPSGDPLDVLWPPDERRRLVWRAPRNPDAPLRLDPSGSRTALVVGGGIAGLSAALELAERGYRVTVRESGEVFGGRLATRDLDPGLGRTFRVEHGLHMWFDNYRVFRDIRRRLEIDHHFRPYGVVHFVFRDYHPEALSSDPKIFPFNLAAIIDRSPNLDWSDVAGTIGILPDLLQFRMRGLYERLDAETFEQWMDRLGVSRRFRDVVLQPAAHVTLNQQSELSAAEMLLYQHLYFVSQPYAFDREITTVDHATAVIDPWVQRLRDLGSRVLSGAPVPGLVLDEDRAVGIVGESDRFDWVVLACDVRGAQRVLAGSEPPDAAAAAALDALRTRVDLQRTAPPYRILRLWLDRGLADHRPDLIETPQHGPLALIAQFHLLEEESREWADSTGGAVLEFHLYALEDELASVPDQQVWSMLRPLAEELLPELAHATVLGSTVGSYEDFTSFASGLGLVRPSPWTPREDGLGNLTLAGDWIAAPTPSALMERSVVTGRLAANECLLADGVRESGYQHVSPNGPLR